MISNSTLVPFADGDKRAIVHFEVTVDSFGRLADTDSHFRIVDEAGRVVLDSAHGQVIGEPLGRPELTQFVGVFPAGGSVSRITTIGNERIAYQRIGAGPNNANHWYAVASARPPSLYWKDSVCSLVAS